MRVVTENTARRKGTQRITGHSSDREKAAPATVAVITADGSRFAEPVTIPGPNRHSELHRLAALSFRDSGKPTTLARSDTLPAGLEVFAGSKNDVSRLAMIDFLLDVGQFAVQL